LLQRLDTGVVTARLIAHGERDSRQILGLANRRIGRHEDRGRRHRVGARVQLAVAGSRRDIHGPVAGAADIRGAAGFQRLVGAHLGALVMDLAGGLLHFLVEGVLEPLVAKISLLLGHPFLQSEVRLDHEFFRHDQAIRFGLWYPASKVE
jgi:hypothetical protein